MRRNEHMSGFDWGEQRTSGISVWPEIFKRTLPNGKEVAIILMDTEGLNSINRASFNRDARVYAFSTYASSVQCFNVFRELNSLYLSMLDLLSGYGSLADKEKSSHPFQNLNIIVRDKPEERHHFEYGRQRDEVKYGFLSNLPSDTKSKKEESNRIYKYYKNIDLFYMPSPGFNVTNSFLFDGNLTEIRSLFIENVEELAESLFAPNHLTVKEINGDAIKAKHFVSYLEKYAEMLNSNELPDLGTYFQVR